MVAPRPSAVVLVRFPFSDLSQTKLRPAVVLADSGRGDRILCQVTSNPCGDLKAIRVEDGDFVIGSPRVLSFARPGKLFTASQGLMVGEGGRLKPARLRAIIDSVVTLLDSGA